jgi:hypothetical protein
VALAAAAALLAFAVVQRDAQHAAESGYLALVAVVVLAAVAALPGRRRAPGALAHHFDLLPWAAVFVVLAAVALPAGAGRGAALLLLLAAALAAALPTALAGPPRRWLDEVAVLLPAALAVQVLFRGGELLAAAPERRIVALFVVLPVAAAAAVAWLAVRHGRAAALVAAALALLACAGLDATSTVVLVTLAAGSLLADPPRSVALGTVGGAALRVAGAVVLVTPFAWRPRTAVLALAAALALAACGPRRRPLGRLFAAGVAAAALVFAFAAPVVGWGVAGERLAFALLLAPLWPAAAAGRRRPVATAVALALALAAARSAPAEAMAAALAFAALTAWGTAGEPAAARPRPSRVALAAWCALLLATSALAAAYPWLRAEPVRTVLDASRLPATGWGAVAAAALIALAAFALLRLPRRYAALLATALALFVFAPRPLLAPHASHALLGRAGAHLTADDPRLDRELAVPVALDRLVADGNLSNAAGVEQGAAVATVRLFAAAPSPGRPVGEPVAAWTLHAGVDLAEWAASRPDVAPSLAHRVPRPWVSWVSPEGDCFGHTYRARFAAAGEVEIGRVTVERHPALPPGVAVHLERLQAVR